MATPNGDGYDILPKKHKKHKREKHEDRQLNFTETPSGLKLILKVGNSSTPEHSSDSFPQNYSVAVPGEEESMHSVASYQNATIATHRMEDRLHKKAKKKKKKKEKYRERHEKKRKHHHKEKRKRLREESSQDDISVGEESLSEPPASKRSAHGHDIKPGTSPVREQRLCVQLLRMRQEKKCPLQKLLDHLQRLLEKKDQQQFFAWPVTDQIAPGYSQIITQPMDLSTIRQKIDEMTYSNLYEFLEDFRLMCNNAMVYNHPDTIYYKAAKRLLHTGMKLMSPDKLRQLVPSLPFMLNIPRNQLGFDISDLRAKVAADRSDNFGNKNNLANYNIAERFDEDAHLRKGPPLPENKFEAVPDCLTPEEILEQAQKAAKAAADKLSLKKPNTTMGFLRQNEDGSTSLAILVPGDGVTPDTNEKPIALGKLVGTLSQGTGQLQGFKEDKRNIAKAVKQLQNGPFGSYAPSYDSTFANLTKEESDLVCQTYGNDSGVQYAESILNFAKDCDYTLTMVDNLLDMLTGGEHRKTKKILEENRRFREEEERLRQLMETTPVSSPAAPTIPSPNDVKIDVSQLKTLADLGIETSFLDYYERTFKEERMMQECLDQTTVLLEKLQQVQNDRLSAPPPSHLSNVMPPSDTELHLAEKITESLTEIAKHVMPGTIAPVAGIRKAMGIDPQPLRQNSSNASNTNSPIGNTQRQSGVVCLDNSGSGEENTGNQEESGVGVDLENEIRVFLESDPSLEGFRLQDDKTIEEMLSES